MLTVRRRVLTWQQDLIGVRALYYSREVESAENRDRKEAAEPGRWRQWTSSNTWAEF